MTWIDELQDEMRRREAEQRAAAKSQNGPNGSQDMASAGTVVRNLLEQMNQDLLGGRGSVWETQIAWGLRLWELWWERNRIEGRYVIVTLLRDSHGNPYLKVQRRRISLRDPRLELRLQRALRNAFLQPAVYSPRTPMSSGRQDLQRSS